MTSGEFGEPRQQTLDAPKLSVCVITYNQEEFVGQCLQSIVDQETDFHFEVIVGDDCSTDGTSAIVDEFAEMYPGMVRVLRQEHNTGGMGNYLAVHREARGIYVSHVDGDDWICPTKFQKQVHCLDSDRECSMVTHRMAIWNDERRVGSTRKNPVSIGLPMLLRYHPMFLHSSIMYRRAMLSDVFASDTTFIDFYVYVAAALCGKIAFIDEILGNYRGNIGISSRRKSMPYIQSAIDLAEHSIGETRDILHCRSRQYVRYSIAALMANDLDDYYSHLEKAKDFAGNRILVHLLHKFRNWPTAIRIMVLTYKRLSFRVRQFHRLLSSQ